MSKNKDKGKQGKKNEAFHAFAQFSQIGVTMVAAVFIGVFLGRYLDGLFGSSPCLLLIFSLLGVGAAIKVIFDFSKGNK